MRNALTLAAAPSRLTAREQAVAGLATRGLTNRQIAAELTVSVKTVEHHLGIVFGSSACPTAPSLSLNCWHVATSRYGTSKN